jgi:hypothetical protein
MIRFLVVALTVVCIVSACSDGNPETPPTPILSGDDVVLASYGSIDYMTATPSIDSGHVLESITCTESAFAMTTSPASSLAS